jgi:hypothetical protein
LRTVIPPFLKGGLGGILIFFSLSLAQTWTQVTDGFFVIETASSTDAFYLKEVFAILQQARQDIRANQALALPEQVLIRIHPTLESFQNATAAAWYLASLADKSTGTIQTQRLRVLLERGSLEKTLRHELFHLAQPEGWPRWLAEGSAMVFAGEQPEAQALTTMSEAQLNDLLATAPSREVLARAAATAYIRALNYWQNHEQ